MAKKKKAKKDKRKKVKVPRDKRKKAVIAAELVEAKQQLAEVQQELEETRTWIEELKKALLPWHNFALRIAEQWCDVCPGRRVQTFFMNKVGKMVAMLTTKENWMVLLQLLKEVVEAEATEEQEKE